MKENVKTLPKEIEEATQQQIFQAVSYAVKDVLLMTGLQTQKALRETGSKDRILYVHGVPDGTCLGNNLINMTAYKEVKEALDEMGIDLNVIEDQEPDAALGNGGLGRLAACFLDSLATLGYAAYGCGIRYRYGMFKQKIEDGYQVEVPDNWLKEWQSVSSSVVRSMQRKSDFGGYVRVEYNEQEEINSSRKVMSLYGCSI